MSDKVDAVFNFTAKPKVSKGDVFTVEGRIAFKTGSDGKPTHAAMRNADEASKDFDFGQTSMSGENGGGKWDLTCNVSGGGVSDACAPLKRYPLTSFRI